MASKEQLKLQEALNASAKEYNLTLETKKAIQDDIAKGHIQDKKELQATLNIMLAMETEAKKAALHNKMSLKARAEQLAIEEQLQDISLELAKGLGKNSKALKKIGAQTATVVENYTKNIQLQMKLGKLSAKQGKQLINDAQQVQQMAKDMQTIANSKLAEPFEKMGDVAGEALSGMTDQLGIFDAALSALQMGGLIGGLLLVVKILKMAVQAATDISNQANELSQNLGISYLQAESMTNEMYDFKAASQGSLSTLEDMMTVQKGFQDSLGISIRMSAEQADMTAAIGAAFGYSADQAGAINGQLVLMGMSIEEATAFQADMAKEANAAGVNVAEVMQDISDSSETVAKFFGNNTKEMKRAAIEARKLGTTLDGMAGVAEGLLDFEESIAAQFEYQVLTGKTLNLDRARQLALEGDIVGATKEALSNFGSAAEFSKADFMSKEAAAKAVGMTVAELQTALNTEEARKKLNKELTAEQMKMAEELGMNMEELAKLEGEDLTTAITNANEAKQASIKMEEVKLALMKALKPLGDQVIAILSDDGFVENLKAAFSQIGLIIGGFQRAFKFMSNLVGGADNLATIMGTLLITSRAYLGVMGLIKAAQVAFNLLKKSEFAQNALIMGQLYVEQGLLYVKQGILSFINTLRKLELGHMAKAAGMMVANAAKAIAEGAMKLASAVGGIFTSMSAIPIAGPALAAVAVGGMMAMFAKAKAKKAGDLAMGANGGPVVMSPREGAIFQGTKNDEIAMGPGVVGAAAGSGGGGGGGAVTDMGPVIAAINGLKASLESVVPMEIKMDGARIAEAVYAANSYKRR
jgi:hypothetical protein